jgi:hypothetical protein
MARAYADYHSRDDHVARRRQTWEEWRALTPAERRHQQLAFQTEQLEHIGAFRGITTDGQLQPNLFSILQTGVPTRGIREAANDLLAAVRQSDRAASYAIDAPEWRLWVNSMELRMRHGWFLEDLEQSQRDAALHLVEASLSVSGFEQIRDLMRLNRTLGEITGDTTILNEWRYYLTLFGQPHADAPWGWQIDGHHLNMNCFVLADQLVLTPCFMGAEPRIADRPPFEGARAFDREQACGLELVRSLSAAQQAEAILFPSMRSDALPPERKHPSEGRMRAGALRDNELMPYEGLRADSLTQAQRGLLVELIGAYVGILPSGHADIRLREIVAHLDETHFAWIGAVDDHSPFFYKVQSPVLLIEFDHHKGVFLDNEEPERFHAHSVVRTPNGNDYGRDLLRQHLLEHPHA